MAAEDLEQVMELESDRFQRLSYAEAAFQTEAGAVYGEYRKTRTEPEFALYEELVATAFERHPYGHTTMGYERDIAIMPTLYDYSRAFFKRYYRPENTVLFIAGDVTPANVFALVEKYYGGWQRGYVAPQIPVEPEQTAERRVDVGYDGQTLPLLQLAYKLPVYDPADRTRVAADLFADLAFGETSEAYRQLVLDEQVVEDLDAGAAYNRDPGLLEISARIKDPAKIDYVLGVIDATIAAVPHRRARRAEARRPAAATALRLPDGPADAGLGRVARRAVRRAARRPARPRSAVRDVCRHHAGRRARARPSATCARERRTVGVLKSRQ